MSMDLYKQEVGGGGLPHRADNEFFSGEGGMPSFACRPGQRLFNLKFPPLQRKKGQFCNYIFIILTTNPIVGLL